MRKIIERLQKFLRATPLSNEDAQAKRAVEDETPLLEIAQSSATEIDNYAEYQDLSKPNGRLVAAIKDRLNPCRTELVKQALEDGAEPDCDIGDYKYPTLLIHEISDTRMDEIEDFSVIDLLIDYGADMKVDMEYACGDGAFDYAVRQGVYNVAHHLIKRGADVNHMHSFQSFVGYGDGFDEDDVLLAKAMFEAGGLCDNAFIKFLKHEQGEERFYLSDRYEYTWESNGTSMAPTEFPTMITLLEEWMAERERTQIMEGLGPLCQEASKKRRM